MGARADSAGRRPRIGRRTFLRAAGIAAVGTALPIRADAAPGPYTPPMNHEQPTVPGIPFLTYRSPPLVPFVDDLPRLPVISAPERLVAADAMHRFHRDLDPAPSFGFGGLTHHGPTIETQAGAEPVITVVNRLQRHPMGTDVDTTLHGASDLDRTHPPLVVHLHGAPNRPADDGFPTSPFRLGRAVTYRFRNPGEAAQLWYHDHSMGTTRLSIYAGLSGHYLVRDEWDTGRHDNPLGLPAGEYETPLVMCDKLFYPDGRLRYDNTPAVAAGHVTGGMAGDTMVVNGVVWPRMSVDRGAYRFRVLSASQLNDYRLSLSDGSPFWVIGSDGGLLDAPVQVRALTISPAERYDILIDFGDRRPGDRIQLINTMQISWVGQAIGATTVRWVMRFDVGSRRGRHRRIPDRLRGSAHQPQVLARIGGERVDRVRTATLNLTANPGNPSWLGVLAMNLNNLPFHTDDFEHPVQGSLECWDLVNADVTMQPHAIHLHLVQFRVVGRWDFDKVRYLADNPPPPFGTRWTPSPRDYLTSALFAPSPYETGWKDTVRCPPDQVTRILVRWPTARELGFDPDAVFAGHNGERLQGYVWHCHLTDHEDNEMMQRLRVVAR
ncbi:multicopper oxidase family protein [Gordonia rhizosphera]|uniref:Putative multicopper oxidase n=1 Tax=Gordonia rhizosphera NBRC 16068 TaxID=1108045 RepID=K6WHL1_9ACTN|nr:multicopper oxidase domain-containing protein [Gordonia rhizosphera]GAB91647.1 putative multicopper oxidase [Gordonia rhizosphera NBRC 16068]